MDLLHPDILWAASALCGVMKSTPNCESGCRFEKRDLEGFLGACGTVESDIPHIILVQIKKSNSHVVLFPFLILGFVATLVAMLATKRVYRAKFCEDCD